MLGTGTELLYSNKKRLNRGTEFHTLKAGIEFNTETEFEALNTGTEFHILNTGTEFNKETEFDILDIGKMIIKNL